MAKIDVTSGTAAGLGSGIIAMRPAGMAPQPAGLTVTPNAGATDADYVITNEKWQYAISHVGSGGETTFITAAEATIPHRRKKVAIAFTDPGAGIVTRVYRKKSTDPTWTEYTETAAAATSFSDDGSQTWIKYMEQPKPIGAVARTYAAIKKGDNFTIESRQLADGNWQVVYKIKEVENYETGYITLSEVANQAGWTNDQAGATQAITDITGW